MRDAGGGPRPQCQGPLKEAPLVSRPAVRARRSPGLRRRDPTSAAEVAQGGAWGSVPAGSLRRPSRTGRAEPRRPDTLPCSAPPGLPLKGLASHPYPSYRACFCHCPKGLSLRRCTLQ